mgnify:FL=1
MLRELASSPGNVVSRERLLAVLPGGSQDPHAAEVAVARLRTALGHSDVVKTVYRRGYRLVGHFAADAAADPATAAPEPPPMSAS